MAAPTAAQILWEHAGSPRTPDSVPYSGLCWWCGQSAPGWGRPVSAVAATFPDRNRASVTTATHICLPCGWTWSDAVRLPQELLSRRLLSKLEKGGLTRYAIQGEAGQLRHLLLPLSNGQIGRWEPGESARDRKGWEESVKSLRDTPVSIGVCAYLGSIDPSEISVSDDSTEKFRSFHHYGAIGQWSPFTDTERLWARDRLLSPPQGWWTMVIGDGKKHAVIYARPSFGAPGLHQSVYFQGSMVDYLPHELSRWILAAERLSFSGARSEEIESGRYQSHDSPLWRQALRQEEPIISSIRGSAALGLVLYCVRSSKALTQSDLYPPIAVEPKAIVVAQEHNGNPPEIRPPSPSTDGGGIQPVLASPQTPALPRNPQHGKQPTSPEPGNKPRQLGLFG